MQQGRGQQRTIGLREFLSSILILNIVHLDFVSAGMYAHHHLTNTGVRQPHDYEVLRLLVPSYKY